MLPFSLRTDKRNQKVEHGEEGGSAIAHTWDWKYGEGKRYEEARADAILIFRRGEGVCFFWWGGRAWQQGRWGLLRFNVRPYGPGTKEAASIISIVRYRAVRRSGDKRTRKKRRGPTNVDF